MKLTDIDHSQRISDFVLNELIVWASVSNEAAYKALLELKYLREERKAHQEARKEAKCD